MRDVVVEAGWWLMRLKAKNGQCHLEIHTHFHSSAISVNANIASRYGCLPNEAGTMSNQYFQNG